MQLTVPPSHVGRRLDALLHELGPKLSRFDARRLAEIGAVSVDGVRALPSERVRAEQTVLVPEGTIAISLTLGMPVLYEDDDLIVLYKLPGLAVHPGTLIEDSVADRLTAHLAGAGLAQRLDRGSSGLLLVGKHKESLRALAQAMESDRIARHYLAVGVGEAQFTERTVDFPLLVTDEPRGDRPKVLVDAKHGQAATTHLQVRASRNGATLFAVRLETGRTHQIRAHLRAIGHPLLGDPRYGDLAANQRAHATHGIARPLLHADRLSFPQPTTGSTLVMQAWLEPDIARLFPTMRS